MTNPTTVVKSSACAICDRLPLLEIESPAYPAPMAADEWAASDRIRGAMIGAAIGDGLGALAHAGQDGPTAPPAGSLRTGGATQLSLFTAEGLIRMYIRVEEKGIGPAWEVIRHALERWQFTQGEEPAHVFSVANPAEWPDGWLVRQHALHHRVSGFSSTRTALASRIDFVSSIAERHVAKASVNQSDAAGALVRGAPSGLVFGAEDALLVGAIGAAYTHGGTAGYLAPAALARVLAGLVRGDQVDLAISQTKTELQGWPGHVEVAPALDGTPDFTHEQPPAVRAFRIGLNALRRKEVVTVNGIRAAVAEGGTASGVVAGALLGAERGATAIGADWRVAPSTIDVIEGMADAMSVAYRAFTMGRQLAGWDWEGSWQKHGSQPAVTILWPRFPGW